MSAVTPSKKAWKQISLAVRKVNKLHQLGGHQVNKPGGTSTTSYPRPFDIKSNGGGKVSVMRCWYQDGPSFIKSASEPEIAVASGTLCAVIDTAASPVTVTLGFDVAYDENTPNLWPLALYEVVVVGTSSVSVVADLRGSTVVKYV